MDFLYSIDVALFRWINEGWSNPVFDGFFKFITNYHYFEAPILALLWVILVRGGKRGRWIVAGLVVTVFLTDQLSAHVFKGLFDRIRPCNVLTGVLTPDDKPSSYSFPSSHATNIGGSMLFMALAYPAWAWVCGLIAFLVGLSRVYLGVHYPSDVLGGWILGAAIGWTVWKIVNPFILKTARPEVPVTKAPVPKVKTRKGRRRARR